MPSLLDPSAFATIVVQVEGKAAVPAAADGKGGHEAAAQAPVSGPLFWGTPFSCRKRTTPGATAGHQSVSGSAGAGKNTDGKAQGWLTAAWDPQAGNPGILVVDRTQEDQTLLLRLGMDGKEVPLANLGRPVGAPVRVGNRPRSGDLAVLANGDLVLADPAGGRILRVTRTGVVTTLAGGDQAKDAKDAKDAGGSGAPLATHTPLVHPMGIAVTAKDEVVFSDMGSHKIHRITSTGHLETLAGAPPMRGGIDANDLTNRFPATIAILGCPTALAVAPDGRIVFVDVANEKIYALRPDGILVVLARVPMPLGVTVTTDNEVVFSTYSGYLGKITPDGRLLGLSGDLRNAETDPDQEPGTRPADLGPLRAEVSDTAEFHHPSLLMATPGGGVLILDGLQVGRFMGPGRGERSLFGQVDQAITAAEHGKAGDVARIRHGLQKWTTFPRSAKGAYDLHLGTLAKGGLAALPKVVQHEVARFGNSDGAGLAVRAGIALHVLDEAVARVSSKPAAAPAALPMAGTSFKAAGEIQGKHALDPAPESAGTPSSAGGTGASSATFSLARLQALLDGPVHAYALSGRTSHGAESIGEIRIGTRGDRILEGRPLRGTEVSFDTKIGEHGRSFGFLGLAEPGGKVPAFLGFPGSESILPIPKAVRFLIEPDGTLREGELVMDLSLVDPAGPGKVTFDPAKPLD